MHGTGWLNTILHNLVQIGLAAEKYAGIVEL